MHATGQHSADETNHGECVCHQVRLQVKPHLTRAVGQQSPCGQSVHSRRVQAQAMSQRWVTQQGDTTTALQPHM